MIITCTNCNKKFDLNQNLIPDKGRLLQCAGCNHKWFFKKEILENTVVSPINENIDKDSINIFDQNSPTNNEEVNQSDLSMHELKVDNEEKIEINKQEKPKKIVENTYEHLSVKTKPKKQKNFKILNIFIVAIISFVAFIIIIDTFKYPIGKIFPNIEFILYNLYESFKDISLFIRDLK
jgi:predicted Zn finger-like uncharacterized protein